jgi:hypothetical protein
LKGAEACQATRKQQRLTAQRSSLGLARTLQEVLQTVWQLVIVAILGVSLVVETMSAKSPLKSNSEKMCS